MQSVALNPSPEFRVARQIVEQLREQGPMREEQLAERVGASEANDTAFAKARRLAIDSAQIRQADDGHWVVRTEADALRENASIRETGVIEDIASAILDHIRLVGVSSSKDLAEACDESEESPQFLAAMSRLEAGGLMSWAGPAIYSVPLAELRHFSPHQNEADRSEWREAGRELTAAIRGLSVAIDVAKSSRANVGVSGPSGDFLEVSAGQLTETPRSSEAPVLTRQVVESFSLALSFFAFAANIQEARKIAAVINQDNRIGLYLQTNWTRWTDDKRAFVCRTPRLWAQVEREWPSSDESRRGQVLATFGDTFSHFRSEMERQPRLGRGI
jgi:hypothetical protein